MLRRISIQHQIKSPVFLAKRWKNTESIQPAVQVQPVPPPNEDQDYRWHKISMGNVKRRQNPFKGKPLPFGRRMIFNTFAEEDLALGRYWAGNRCREGEWFDRDFFQRGWGDWETHIFEGKGNALKRPYPDVLCNNDPDYQFRSKNVDMHMQMIKYIPELAPLMPEIQEDYDAVFQEYTKILDDVLPVDEAKKNPLFKPSKKQLEKQHLVNGRTLCTNSSERKFYMKEKCELNIGDNLKKLRKIETTESRNQTVKDNIIRAVTRKFIDEQLEGQHVIRLTFVDALGSTHYTYGFVGETLLHAMRRYGVPIDAFCNHGDESAVQALGPACAQCQVNIDPAYYKFMPAIPFNELFKYTDFVTITPTSRLSCTLFVQPEWDGMRVHIPIQAMVPSTHHDCNEPRTRMNYEDQGLWCCMPMHYFECGVGFDYETTGDAKPRAKGWDYEADYRNDWTTMHDKADEGSFQ